MQFAGDERAGSYLENPLDTFLAESHEHIELFEKLLLDLEAHPEAAAEGFGALFRSMHTIKGMAGMVEQPTIEFFAHVLEEVLDRLRAGQVRLERELVSLLLAGGDHLRLLLSAAASGQPGGGEFADADRARLIGALTPYLESAMAAPVTALVPATPMPVGGRWQVSVRFDPHVLRQGLDPVYFLRHLESLGRVSGLKAHADAMPPLASYDPEQCYLYFTLQLDSMADKTAIEQVFAFVLEACELRIKAPPEIEAGWRERLENQPDDAQRLGELLCDIGAVTPRELQRALAAQSDSEHPLHGLGIGAILARQGAVASDLVTEVAIHQQESRVRQPAEVASVRVPREALEHLLSTVFNLAGVAHNARHYQDRVGPGLAGEIEAMSALTADAMEGARRLLTQRAGEAFRRLYRAVRDLGTQLGKAVDLTLEGEDLEIDRLQAESLGEAVLHLVRNALDHGIESTAVRVAAGKAPRGRLSVSVAYEGNELVLCVADDGCGIDCEALRARAVERGLMREGAQRSEAALLDMIFMPGFSTAATAGRTSGRGVGLDVVRQSVRELGGSVQVETELGHGTRFMLRVPVPSKAADHVASNVLRSSRFSNYKVA